MSSTYHVKEGSKVYFCLSSGGYEKYFPDNTSTQFHCPLPEDHFNPSRLPTQIRLLSIGLSNTVVDGETNPGYLKVNVDQLSGTLDNGVSAENFLGGFHFPAGETTLEGYGYHVFKRGLFLPLHFHRLSLLSVSIVDVNDKPVKLAEGHHTRLWIEMSVRPREEQFTITCNSLQPDFFPDNQLFDFTSPLRSDLILPDYEVALLNIVYPPLLNDAPRPTIFSLDDDEFGYVPEGPHTDEFVSRVNRLIQKSRFKGMVFFKRFGLGRRNRPGHAYFSRPHGPGGEGIVRLRVGHQFQRACGIGIPFPIDVTLEGGRRWVFPQRAALSLVLPNPVAILTCDLVGSSVVGDRRDTLLQCAPVISKNTDSPSRLYEPENLCFHKVKEYPFGSIRFRFTELEGGELKRIYAPPEQKMTITLLFRKIKK